MKTATRILALCLVCVLTLGLAGCHKKGEIAVTVGDYDFTSGYYACALVFADNEARSIIDTELAEEATADIDYHKQKVEDTDYVEWVEQTALDNIKAIAAYKTLCAKAEISLDDGTDELVKANVDYLWENNGYSLLLEPNGVAKDTFEQYMTDTYYADKYFMHLYGKEGEKAISDDELTTQFNNNYVLVNLLQADFSSKTQEEINDITAKFTSYEADIKGGKRTFEEIYLEHNGISADEHTHSEVQEGELQPQDHHATVLGSEDTDYASDYYDDAKDMATGEVKLITLENGAGMVLVVKKDIAADPYYLQTLDQTIRYDIAGEDFDKDIKEYANELECDINKSSIKQFKVKKIVYPQ